MAEPTHVLMVEVDPALGWQPANLWWLTDEHLAGRACVDCGDPDRPDEPQWWHGRLVPIGVVADRAPGGVPGDETGGMVEQEHAGTRMFAHEVCVDTLEAVERAIRSTTGRPTLFADRSPGHVRGDLRLVHDALVEVLADAMEVCDHYRQADLPGLLAAALEEVAREHGGSHALVAHRPGSWEAVHVQALAAGADYDL